MITIFNCSRLLKACLVFGLPLGLPLGLVCVCSCLIPDRRPVIGNALLYLSITLLYNLKGFPELMVFLLLDANDSMVFNAVLIFLIFLSSYSLIISLILALFESGAYFRCDLNPMILVWKHEVWKFHFYIYKIFCICLKLN